MWLKNCYVFIFVTAVFASTIMALSENMDWTFADDALDSMLKTLAFKRFAKPHTFFKQIPVLPNFAVPDNLNYC